MQRLLDFCAALNERQIAYDLKNVRDGAVVVAVVVPGEYWEIEFFTDDSLEIERFVSQGVVGAEPADLEQLLSLFE
jgi:hypothetical protein